MVVTDPIADLLTRIRNALTAKHETVSVPVSKMKKAIVDILVAEGFVICDQCEVILHYSFDLHFSNN